jgi:hypothetical protein
MWLIPSKQRALKRTIDGTGRQHRACPDSLEGRILAGRSFRQAIGAGS